ncbi:hypothetical protein P3T23_000433 [Paraburkholderia sp. GAS448]
MNFYFNHFRCLNATNSQLAKVYAHKQTSVI